MTGEIDSLKGSIVTAMANIELIGGRWFRDARQKKREKEKDRKRKGAGRERETDRTIENIILPSN